MPSLAWAYEFESTLSQQELMDRLTAAGPVDVEPARERVVRRVPDLRTPEGVRVRIHDRREPFFGSSEREPGPRCKCRLDRSSGDAETRASVDSNFRDVLRFAGLTEPTASTPTTEGRMA